jgi:hypothetical protein
VDSSQHLGLYSTPLDFSEWRSNPAMQYLQGAVEYDPNLLDPNSWILGSQQSSSPQISEGVLIIRGQNDDSKPNTQFSSANQYSDITT